MVKNIPNRYPAVTISSVEPCVTASCCRFFPRVHSLEYRFQPIVNRTSHVSFDLWRNCYIKNVVLFEENSILPLPECLESSGW